MNEMAKTMLKIAVWYGVHGLKIIPIYGMRKRSFDGKGVLVCGCGNKECKPPTSGKHPMIKDWPNNATCDPVIIKNWFEKVNDINIGIVTGVASNLFVVDIDNKNDGHTTLEIMEEEHGKFPETVEVLTGNGKHFFFKHPGFPVKGVTGVYKGIDIRGEGNYVVAPRSLHFSGNRYEFKGDQAMGQILIAHAPEWLLKVLKAKNGTQTTTARSGNSNKGKTEGWMPLSIPDGKRNDTLNRVAGSMRRPGMEWDEILGGLKVVNANRCKPPLSGAELEKLAKNMCRYSK